jgi:mannose-6-phosphate isomerase-like protein (cupin superfamily)
VSEEGFVVEFIRPFDDEKAFDTGFPGYRAQFASHLESALLIHSVIQAGGSGPGLHYHHSDQIYFLLEGSMNVQLGEEVHVAERGSLVFIPAGLPHRNWNSGTGVERHFEMIVPAPLPGAKLAHLVDSVGDVPAEARGSKPGYVRCVNGESLEEVMTGFRLQQLADPGSGSRHAVVNYAEVDPGAAGPSTHVHDFDQYYLVIGGELTVEVALEKHVVPPDTLVLLPAGVPHRQYNAGTETERHLVLLAPPPTTGMPWDRGVDFAANGEAHSGPNVLVSHE